MVVSAKELRAQEIAGRLQWAIGETGITVAGLAKLARVRADAIGRLLSPDKKTGHRRLPDLLALARLAHALPPMTAGWLVFGEGPEPELAPAPAEYRDRRRRNGEPEPDRSQAT